MATWEQTIIIGICTKQGIEREKSITEVVRDVLRFTRSAATDLLERLECASAHKRHLTTILAEARSIDSVLAARERQANARPDSGPAVGAIFNQMFELAKRNNNLDLYDALKKVSSRYITAQRQVQQENKSAHEAMKLFTEQLIREAHEQASERQNDIEDMLDEEDREVTSEMCNALEEMEDLREERRDLRRAWDDSSKRLNEANKRQEEFRTLRTEYSTKR